MNRDAIGVNAGVVAAIAVIFSVVYLAVQIRSAARESQAQTMSNQVADFGPFLQWQIENKAFTEVFRQGLLDCQSLDPADRLRVSHALYHLLMGFKDILEAHERGLVDAESHHAWESDVRSLLKMSGGLE